MKQLPLITIFVIIFFLAISLTSATRSQPKEDNGHDTSAKDGGGGFFVPGGFSNGWGSSGTGYGGGPSGGYGGGYSKGGINVECKEKRPCYKKKLTCPANCFHSYSRSGNNYAAAGGGGGCTIDCNNTCTAYC